MTRLLLRTVKKGLQTEDPRLALEVARHWSRNPERDADIEDLVTTVLAKANSDHGFMQLEIWFYGPFQRLLTARDAAAARKVRVRKTDRDRTPADIELRPIEARHLYRYQVHRLPDAS